MDEAEYWLLNSVVELRYPLRLLVAENLAEVFNAPGHGLSRAELTAVLLRLFHQGDLVAVPYERHAPVRMFVPTPDELEAALTGRLDATYALTPQGGARWEVVSRPDWTRFVQVSYGEDDAEVISMDRQLVETYFAWQHYDWSEALVVPETIVWDVLTPWQATYWKQLATAHRVRYGVTYGPPVLRVPPPEISAWLEGLLHWYSHPFLQAGP